ncbi:MAG: hypothetical protein A3I52_01620 [Candidatus Blackburnbacteria bacterium RIFCSPLOWO2_02_FULL_40_10]|nr:MAG: hypothetical protein A3I52_01620 [Candidatus Blackburnbacteria bacterium RIFCSPLOWO2_02_FULL_40_10]
MRILFFGDIFGKPGREALKFIIPQWKKEYEPDVIIANGENMSHGAGISESAIKELMSAGVQIITGGNHTLEGKNASNLLNDASLPLLRPANMSSELPGRGFGFYRIGNNPLDPARGRELGIMDGPENANLLVINLIGQVHMRYQYDSPFKAIDEILQGPTLKSERSGLVKIVDWHADASSEKIALGWYLDGRVSAVLGTHSHTPTADERILPKGTSFVSDIGMIGPHNSIIGQEISANLERFIKQIPKKVEVAPAPPYEINAVFLETDEKTGKTIKIQRIRKIIHENLARNE